MAKAKYDFLNDAFTVFDNVETPKIELKFPLADSPLDISSWASEVIKTDKGEETPIAKGIRYTMDVDTTPDVPIVMAEPLKTSPITSSNEWQNQLVNAYKKLGLSDNAIRNLIAKNSLESRDGQSQMSKYFNYGNITAGKGYTGSIVEGDDKDKNGKSIKLKFRAYKSIDDYVKDELNLLLKRYDFNPNDSIDVFLDKLQGNNSSGYQYAESNSYKTTVRNRYNKLFG